MANIRKVKLPGSSTVYNVTDASITTLGNNTNLNKENKTVVSDYIASRAENLLTNGTALLGNNYNFSGLTFDGSETYYAAGSFKKEKPTAYWTFTNDEYIPVDVNATYRFDFYTKTNKAGTGSSAPQFNGMITAFDIDKNQIVSYQVAPRANTLTTLAQELKPGDTKIYFTSIANFSRTSLSTNNASLLFYGYKNSYGYEYAPETYTRYRYTNLWSSVDQMDFENNVITLTSAWSAGNPTFPAGTPVSQGQDGSGALYCSVNDIGTTFTQTAGDWQHCWYHINGLQSKNGFPQSQFPFGTAYIKVGLMNRIAYANGESLWISTMSFTTEGASVDQVKTSNSSTTYNYDYPLLFKGQKNADTEIANTRFADITYNPYTRAFKVNGSSIKPGTLVTNNTSAQTASASESLTGTINLHKISKTGTYTDLISKPILNTNNATALSPGSETIDGTINLHKIAKTGSYNDLLDKPDTEKEIFWATYGTTTGEEISTALSSGKYVAVRRVSDTSTNITYGNCVLHNGEGRWYFETFYGSYTRLYATCTVNGSTWSSGTATFVGGVRIGTAANTSSSVSTVTSGTSYIITPTAYDPSTNKMATIADVPKKTSDLTNDGDGTSPYATEDDVQDVREIAEGKTKAYVVSDAVMTEFNSSNSEISILRDIVTTNAGTISLNDINIGDAFFVSETDVPDRWCSYLGSDGRIPAAYQEVEYLQSDGAAYIDLGYAIKANDEIFLDVMPLVSGVDKAFFGAYQQSGQACECSQLANAYRLNVSDNSIPLNVNTTTSFHRTTNGYWNAETEGGTSYFDKAQQTTDMTTNAVLFGRRYNNVDKVGTCRIYRFSITGVMNLIPCYRKSDSVSGMYDILNDVFYTKSGGSGTLTVGPNIIDPTGITNITLSKLETVKVPVNDVRVDGSSVVDQYGVAQIISPTIDSTPTEQSTNAVSSGGVYSALQNVIEVAEGKTNTFVVSSVTNPAFNTQNETILIPSHVTDIEGNIIYVDDMNIGDNFYVSEADVPDRWVSSKSILPSTHTQLEYIESTGTQYINTGIFQNYGTKTAFEIDYLTTQATGYFGGNGFTQLPMTNDVLNDRKIKKVVYNIDGKTDYYTNGTKTSTASWGTSTTYNGCFIGLCALGMGATSVTNFSKSKLYRAKVWENDMLVRDYIPCKQNNDDAIGMYDLVNNVFVKSSGSGEFLNGPIQDGATLTILETAKVPVTSISVNNVTQTPDNGNVNITVPTNADYVDLTSTQSIGGQKTFTANRLYINGETHFNAGGNPTDYAYGQAVGIFGKNMMVNTLYVPQFKYRTSAMNTAGKSATVWNLPNLDSGNTYTLATTEDINTAQISESQVTNLVEDLQDIREAAEGKKQTYVCDVEHNNVLNTQAASVAIVQPLVDIEGNSITLNALKVGDTIYVTDTAVPDRWVSSFVDRVPVSTAEGSSVQEDTPAPTSPAEVTSLTYYDTSYNPVEVRGIGAIKDEYSGGTLTHNIGVYTFDGSESFDNSASGTLAGHRVFRNTSLFSTYIPITSEANPFYCTHFTPQYTSTYTVSGQVTRWQSGATPTSQGMFCIPEEVIGITSSASQSQAVTAFQTWLAQQAANGTPVKIYYPLKTSSAQEIILYAVGPRTGAYLDILETAKASITDVQTKERGDTDYSSVVTNTIAKIDLSNYATSTDLPDDYIHSGDYSNTEYRTGGLVIGAKDATTASQAGGTGKVFLVGNSTPTVGLKSDTANSSQFYIQATKDDLYVGPTSTSNALKISNASGSVGNVSLPADLSVAGAESVVGNLSVGDSSHNSNLTVKGSVTAGSFIKTGGTSAQFLKADGSVDATQYSTFSGAYSDLTGKPQNLSDFNNDTGFVTNSTAQISESQVTNLVTDLQEIREAAEGKKQTYVVSSQTVSAFASIADPISLTGTTFTDIEGNSHDISDLKVGDTVYVQENNYPDRWIGSVVQDVGGQTYTATCYKLEEKPDLSTYALLTDIGNGTLTIQRQGTTIASFGANQSSNTSVDVSDLFFCTYGETTISDITAAYAANKLPVCKYNNQLYVYGGLSNSYYWFFFTTNRRVSVCKINTGTGEWSWDADDFEFQYYKRKSTSGWGGGDSTNVSDNYYPSEKLTYETITSVDTSAVHKTGNETIAGVKTFSSGQIKGTIDSTDYTYTLPSATGTLALTSDSVDKVDDLHLLDQSYSYKYKFEIDIQCVNAVVNTGLTESEIFALTGSLYGKLYLASDTGKYWRRNKTATTASSSNWRNDTTAAIASLAKPNQLTTEDAIYVRIDTKTPYYSRLPKFYVDCSYDNISGSTTITGFCRQQNQFEITSCSYNGNNLVGIFQPTANTNIYVFKFTKYRSTYGATNTYNVPVTIYSNFISNGATIEFIDVNHTDYNTVKNYSYVAVPTYGIKGTNIQNSLIPVSNNTYTLGTSSIYWNAGYINNLYLNGTLTSSVPRITSANKVLLSTTTSGITKWSDWTTARLLKSSTDGTIAQESLKTAYTAKGTSTKVPQITTNEFGLVTGITEVDINFPTPTVDTNQKVKTNDATFGNNSEVNFVGSGATTITGDSSTNTITISSPNFTDTNQKVKTSDTTFGADDVIEFVSGSNVSVYGNSTNKTITISAIDTNENQKIKGNGTSFGINDSVDLVPAQNDAISIRADLSDPSAPKVIFSGENRTASQSGSDKSVVTTGEKYIWNNKQDEITASNELSSDLVDDTNKTNRFVTEEMYNYLDDQLYKRPTISTFTLYNGGSAVSTTIEKGTVLTIGQIRHNETSISNISTLKLKNGSTEIQDVTPVANATTITLSSPLSVSATTTYTLSGTNTRNESFTKDAKINVYSYAYSKTTTSTTVPTSGLTKRSVYTTFQSSGDTISYTAGDYLYLYVPAASSATHIETNALGSWGSVATHDCGTVTITKANGTTESYKCFRTEVTFSATGSAPYRVC